MAEEDLLNMIKAISSRIGLYRFKTLEQSAVDLVENLKMNCFRNRKNAQETWQPQKAVEEHSMAVQIKNESEMQLLVALGELMNPFRYLRI